MLKYFNIYKHSLLYQNPQNLILIAQNLFCLNSNVLCVVFYAKCSVNFETFGGKDKKVSVKFQICMNSSMLSSSIINSKYEYKFERT